MAFQHRTKRLNGRGRDIINLNHAVRVPHGDHAAQDCLFRGAHDIGLFRFVGAERHLRWLEVRLAHVDPHQLIVGDAQHHSPISSADADITLVGQPFQPDKAGKTARAVATLGDFAAVSIKDAVVKIEIGIVRRLNHQQLIKPDPEVPIGQAADQLRRKEDILRYRVDDHKIIAKAMHFRELHYLLHCAVRNARQ